MPNISTRPPVIDKQYEKANFIKGASENKLNLSLESSNLPWKQKHIREDVKKAFTVQIPEEEQTNQSQQKIAREAIIKSINEIIESILNHK
jgi:hypothetical protein